MIEIELERTFLLKTLPPQLSDAPYKDMVDIYIPTTAHHPTLRIRKNGAKCVITKKEPVVEGDSSRQQENTIPLREDEYVELQSLLPGKRIEKRRYAYSENGYTYEIDVFGGRLQGLVLADIEFESEEKMTAYTPPPWVLAEVTQEKFLAGGMLCGKSYDDIAPQLAAFTYQQIR